MLGQLRNINLVKCSNMSNKSDIMSNKSDMFYIDFVSR